MGSEGPSRFSLSAINSSNIDTFLPGLKPIDVAGLDSKVFKFHNDFVLKEYLRLPLRQILLYQEVTNNVATLAYRYKTHTKGLGIIQLEVEPVIKVVQSDETGLVYAISRFVKGSRLKQNKIPEIDDLLRQFSKNMNNDLKLNGIHVDPSNTKLIPGPLPFYGSICNITDICASISELSKL